MPVYWVQTGRTASRLMWGLFLIGLGVVLMLDYEGLVPWLHHHTSWPLIVVAIGLVQAATGWSAKRLAGGVTLMLIGGWLWIAANRWHGLDWTNSWPLALVASGIGMIVRALAAPLYRRFAQAQEGDVHVLD